MKKQHVIFRYTAKNDQNDQKERGGGGSGKVSDVGEHKPKRRASLKQKE